MAKAPFAPPPTLEDTKAAPSPIDRKSSSARTEQFNFQVSPELKKDIKMMCAELDISYTEYLEKMHAYYIANHRG
ncbi:hypothetical protein VPZ60_004311 [Salmonella enterica]|nr:hypothetical protein [Salmonella enterica]